MRQVNMTPGASSTCVFYHSDVDGSGLVHGDDFCRCNVLVARQGGWEAFAEQVECHGTDVWTRV